jgi:hemoglobin
MSHSITDLAGGLDAFIRLVDAFYVHVRRDEVLLPMYPDDLEPGKRHLALFLAQYFGETDLYSAQRGHPRLRMRHAPFPIDLDAASRWATHMLAAVSEQSFPKEVQAALEEYVFRATPTLINQRTPGPGPADAGGLPTTT